MVSAKVLLPRGFILLVAMYSLRDVSSHRHCGDLLTAIHNSAGIAIRNSMLQLSFDSGWMLSK